MTDRLSNRLSALAEKATKGPWETGEDPLGGDYMVEITLPHRSGGWPTSLARCVHNWNEAEAGEHRISWKEAETNAALIVELVNNLPTIISALQEKDM